MAEVLAQIDSRVVNDNVTYRVQACGGPMPDGLWEGWLEFIPVDGGTPIRSPRETTQPNRVCAEYWATGLTATYLEGALERALRPAVRHVTDVAAPLFTKPARPAATAAGIVTHAEAVLDPFTVYRKSEALLSQELHALSAWHLVNIIRAYRLSADSTETLKQLSPSQLIERIIAGVRAEAG